MGLNVHCDGSSSGKVNCLPEVVDGQLTWLGPGGWAWIIERDGQVLECRYGHNLRTTNNIMESTAAVFGLLAAREYRLGNETVTLVSDSQITLGLASGQFSPSKNEDLASRLRTLMIELQAGWRWIRGHQIKKDTVYSPETHDAFFNNRCDQLAHMGKMEARAGKLWKTTRSSGHEI